MDSLYLLDLHLEHVLLLVLHPGHTRSPEYIVLHLDLVHLECIGEYLDARVVPWRHGDAAVEVTQVRPGHAETVEPSMF
jgi:hypothetical protein